MAKPNAADKQYVCKFFTAASLAGKPVPKRRWLVPNMIPSGAVTLLFGDGGAGKSTAALQLAVATWMNRLWLGREVEHGRALYLSAEDPEDELHRRVFAIAAAENIRLEECEGLTLCSLAGEDAQLVIPDHRYGGLASTPLFDELDERIGDERPGLVVLDTLADFHSGEERDRAQARAFIGKLNGLGIRHSCAVLLLAHPSLTGMSSGTGTSGSTGWKQQRPVSALPHQSGRRRDRTPTAGR